MRRRPPSVERESRVQAKSASRCCLAQLAWRRTFAAKVAPGGVGLFDSDLGAAQLRFYRPAEATVAPSTKPKPGQIHRAPPGALQLIDAGTVPAQLPSRLLDLAYLGRLQMLSNGRQSDRGHGLGLGSAGEDLRA
jgi:hypothetical protein